MVSHAEVSSLLPPGTVQQPAPTSRPGKLTPLGGAPGKLAPLGNATSAPSRLSTQQAYLTPEPTTSTCGLTPEQIKELRGKYNWMTESALISLGELFTEWDEDGTGEISCEEMGATLSKVVRELFDKLDTDKSGSLTKKEVERLCHNLGMSVSNKEVDKWVQDMKRDSENPKGDVSFQDFERWWNGHEDGEVTEEELKDLFEEVDEDGSGEVDIMEFINMISIKMDGKNLDDKTPFQMVRAALESVRMDVRAIYGSSAKPKGAMERMRELEMEGKQRCCFFRTDGPTRQDKFRKLWDVLQVFLLVYVAIMVPYRTGFQVDIPTLSAEFWFEVGVDIYFAFDILINFRTTYRTEEGLLVVHPGKIARNYLKSWFAIDVAACLPVTYIALLLNSSGSNGGGGGGAENLKALKIIRLLRLAKMLRLARLKRILKRLDEDFPGIWTVSQLFSLVLIILYISHIFACFWYFVGTNDQIFPPPDGYAPCPANTTASACWDSNGPACSARRHCCVCDIDDPSCVNHACEVRVRGWVQAMGWASNIGWSTRYVDAYYYAITTLTTVGYGDRTPSTDPEKVFSIVTELAGGMIFGILAGTLSSMLTEANAAAAEVESELDSIKNFMLNKGVKKKLRRDIMATMETFYKTKGLHDEDAVLNKLPPKFKKVLLVEMYKPQLSRCPLFLGLDNTIITQLAMVMLPYLAIEGDIIVEEGNVGDEMYMVVNGEVKLESDAYPKFSGKAWVDGAFFGELPMLGLGAGDLRNQHQYSVEAMVESQLTFLRRENMEVMEEDYPMFKSQVRQLAAKRAQRFGIDVQRVTLTVQNSRRRHSIALDDNEMAKLDPEMAKAFRRGAAAASESASTPEEAGVVPLQPVVAMDFSPAEAKRRQMKAQTAGPPVEDDSDEEDEIPGLETTRDNNAKAAGVGNLDDDVTEMIMAKLELLENKINFLQATVEPTTRVRG